jgi:archaellum component FlaC
MKKLSDLYFWLISILESLNVFLATLSVLFCIAYVQFLNDKPYTFENVWKFFKAIDAINWIAAVILAFFISNLLSTLTRTAKKNNKQMRTLKRTQDMKLKEFSQEIITNFGNRFDILDERFDKMDERFDKMDERFDKIDERLDKMDERFDNLDTSIEVINNNQETLTFKVDNLQKNHTKMFNILQKLVTIVQSIITK